MKKSGKVLAIIAVLVIVVAAISSSVQASKSQAAQSFSETVINQMENSLPAFQSGDEGESSYDDGDEANAIEDHEDSEDSDAEAYGAGEYGSDSDDDLVGEDKDDDEDEDDDDIALGGSSILGNVGIAGAVLVTLVFLSQSASGMMARARNWLKRK